MNVTGSHRASTRVLMTLIVALSAFPIFALTTPSDDTTDKSQGPQVSVAMTEALPGFELIEAGSDKAMALYDMQDFFARYSDAWQVGWDNKSGRPNIVSGAGIPILPGRGNDLTRSKAGLSDEGELTVDDVAGLLRAFIDQQQKVFQISNEDLVLDASRSLVYGKNRHFWSIELQQTLQGVPVEGAHVFFRINNGNLVQFGANKVAEIALDPRPSIPQKKALDLGLSFAGVLQDDIELTDRGTLKIVPIQSADQGVGEKYQGPLALGYEHVLVWEVSFLGANDHGYRVRVDAHSGEVLEVSDRTLFAEVMANVYPVSNNDPLLQVGLPFASVSNNGTRITDADGNYSYSGGTARVTLNGRYTRIDDACGNISLSDSNNGDLDLGGAGGTDCTTPGFGGAGNTHSARTGFYHLTNINRTAAAFLPNNNWLNGTLEANMNINANCNAFWNGSTVNFYTSGGGCGNTGENAGVFLHEWGHGMDSNAGATSPENGTGEAVGDTFSAVELRDPCIGEGFTNTACNNCNASCTGVRDISAFASGGISTISRPSTVENNNGINCDRFIGAGNVSCPYRTRTGFQPYQGPMGYEGHCESYIASSANWDLAQSLVAEHGTEAGWSKMEDLWYGIMTPMGSAYQLTGGGQCNPAANVDGCGADNWYTLYLAADDDDGNLANGTPNGCRIWDAFNDHGIACGAQPQCFGGGGGGGGGNQVVSFSSEASNDGWVRESSQNSNVGGKVNATSTGGTAVRAGDNKGKRQYMGVLSFNTGSLPNNAVIVRATLKLRRGSVKGNPFGTLGDLVVDVNDGNFGGGAALANGDFQAAATASAVATIPNTGAPSVDFDASGRGAINDAGRTQIRLRFTLDDDNDNKNDFVGFFGGDTGTAANRPVLEIEYQ